MIGAARTRRLNIGREGRDMAKWGDEEQVADTNDSAFCRLDSKV